MVSTSTHPADDISFRHNDIRVWIEKLGVEVGGGVGGIFDEDPPDTRVEAHHDPSCHIYTQELPVIFRADCKLCRTENSLFNGLIAGTGHPFHTRWTKKTMADKCVACERRAPRRMPRCPVWTLACQSRIL